MNLDYSGSTKIKLDRALPSKKNLCRVTVLANVLNFYADQKLFTPEKILDEINAHLAQDNQLPIDTDLDSVQDSQSDDCLHRNAPDLSVIRVTGEKYLDISLWRQLIDKGFLLVANHQQLYYDPLSPADGNSLAYLPADLAKRLIYEPNFSYQTFTDLYRFYLDRNKRIIEGHVDIVLDLITFEGLDFIILANLSSTGNKSFAKIPFNFYRNHLAFDWYNEK